MSRACIPNINSIAFLLVTCCLEQTRSGVLSQVVANLTEQAPELRDILTVFDNASTVPGTQQLLRAHFNDIYVASQNIGYWSAIDWWVQQLGTVASPPTYCYIIESDLTHFAFQRIYECATYLNQRPHIGGVRLHEYDVANRHLYDKDRPVAGSKRDIWRSHTNSTTRQRVELLHDRGDFYTTNFNAHLVALNRYDMLSAVFAQLREMKNFTEHDFQRLCHELYSQNAILDGGIYHDRLASYGGPNVMGSYTAPADLQRMGYLTTRQASIVPATEYTVTRLA